MAPQHSNNKNKSEHLCIILTKNARISTFSSVLMTNTCLICNAIVAASKKCDAVRHLMTMHKDYISKYSDKSESCRNKAEDLERHLRSRHTY